MFYENGNVMNLKRIRAGELKEWGSTGLHHLNMLTGMPGTG
jgi:hypothetical protein